jgi:uncharacterized protein
MNIQHSYAQDNLGACYRDGIGVPVDLELAREWFQRSAEGGNAEAQSALGTMLVTGQGGAEDIATGCAMWQRFVLYMLICVWCV